MARRFLVSVTFAFELAAFIHHLSQPAGHLLKWRFKLCGRRLSEFAQVPRGLARGHAGQCLDVPHPGRHAAVGHSEDQADVAGALDVRAAAQFDHQPMVLPPEPLGILAHRNHTHLVAVLLAEQRPGAGMARAS